MRYAINIPCFGDFGDPRVVADLAREAEAAGWDGFFLWDHIGSDWPAPIADPWIELAAIAATTQRIKIGPMVTPIPRRRPWKLAHETVTLDLLSSGRLILGVGIGSDSIGREYSAYGESPDDKLHAAMLDEGLEVLTGLWSGESFSYSGQHYTINNARYLPQPVQSPRIPIWVAGVWPSKRPFRRAARWDGVVPLERSERPPTPDEVREMLAYIQQYRDSADPFDIIVAGYTGDKDPAQAAALLGDYAAAGATWWQEGFLPEDSAENARQRIRQGPPHM